MEPSGAAKSGQLLLETPNNCKKMATTPNPNGLNDWKNPVFIEGWKAERRDRLKDAWWNNPLFSGIPLSANRNTSRPGAWDVAREFLPIENESLTLRASRLEECTSAQSHGLGRSKTRSGYSVPSLIGKDSAGDWAISPVAAKAQADKLEKAKCLFDHNLTKKAERELACGLLGGVVICRNGHQFKVGYECGNRYCIRCGPKASTRLFAKHLERLAPVIARIAPCWPPPRGEKPQVVIAKIDFTLKNTGTLPTPKLMRRLNECIKKFCRAIERRYGIARSEYGLAYCDELGGGNTNAHAHGVYVGPWLPQSKKFKELSKLWAEMTQDGSFIISIKYAKSFAAALYHAVKYPAKLISSSSPERLADLEAVFHRVRRFHTLAAFYNPKLDPTETKTAVQEDSLRRCPLCSELLSEITKWVPLVQLEKLSDLREVPRGQSRARILSG